MLYKKIRKFQVNKTIAGVNNALLRRHRMTLKTVPTLWEGIKILHPGKANFSSQPAMPKFPCKADLYTDIQKGLETCFLCQGLQNLDPTPSSTFLTVSVFPKSCSPGPQPGTVYTTLCTDINGKPANLGAKLPCKWAQPLRRLCYNK